MQDPALKRRSLLRRFCDSDDLFARIEFLPGSDVSASAMPRGLLMLMAFWSGPSILGFKNICQVFRQNHLPDDFIFRVLDIDGVCAGLLEKLAQHPIVIGGNAEGYWFRNGTIFSATTAHSATNDRIQELLTEST